MKEKIEKILADVLGKDFTLEVFVPEYEAHGHYSMNAALRLAKTQKRNPLDLAREFAEKIKSSAPAGFFEKVDIAPPGFINLWVAPKVLQEELGGIYKNIKSYGKNNNGGGKKVIVEYSQPNIAKKMHVGHLRTTIIGDALANILEFSGYKVIRWNYLGDWGTQFGKLIAAYKLWGDEKKIEADPINELQALYVRFHEEIKNRPDLEKRGQEKFSAEGVSASGGKNTDLGKRGQEEFRKLEDGDEENRKLWEWFKKESLIEFEKTYGTLGVKFDTYIGESFYEKDLKPLVGRLLKDGIAKESQGAIVIPLGSASGGGSPPALIQKSDGASLYLTRDIANLEYRLKKYKPEKILYVVGNEQSLHFEQLFAVADILGLSAGAELKHIKYGLVLGEEGKKLATREGRAILLEDVLEKAIRLAREVVDKKATDVPTAEKEKIAEAVGVGSLKYGILKENRNTDISFNWQKMLDFHGDSAPYLQYSYARLRSIVRKSEILNPKSETSLKSKIQNPKIDFGQLGDEVELRLMRKILEFPDEIARSGEILETNNLANYLYKLASLVSRFYETTPVLKEEDEPRRNALLALINASASVLRTGLGLLGIKTLERI